MKRILKWRAQSGDETRELSNSGLNAANIPQAGALGFQPPCPLNGFSPDYRSPSASSSRAYSDLAHFAAMDAVALPSYNPIMTNIPPHSATSGFLPPSMGFSTGFFNSTMFLPYCQNRLNLPTVKVHTDH